MMAFQYFRVLDDFRAKFFDIARPFEVDHDESRHVIAGLAAEGFTTVEEVAYIERGYESFVEKLRELGAEIERVSSEDEVQKFKYKVG